MTLVMFAGAGRVGVFGDEKPAQRWPRTWAYASCLATLLLLARPDDALFAQTTVDELREFAIERINQGSVKLAEPKFEEKDNKLLYVLGGAPVADFGDSPVATALKWEYRVLAIRLNRNSPEQRQTWDPILAKVDAEIGELLEDAHEVRDDKQARRLAREHDEAIEKLLAGELDLVARNNGLQGSVSGATVEVYRDLSLATFVIEPADGNLRYCWRGPWELFVFQRRRGREVDEPQMSSLANGDKLGKGHYHFRVTWADSTRDEDVEVKGQLGLRFTKTGLEVFTPNP